MNYSLRKCRRIEGFDAATGGGDAHPPFPLVEPMDPWGQIIYWQRECS
jgi:hypothetical protein